MKARDQTGTGTTVIVDHPSRLARDIAVHIKLRDAIRAAGGQIVTPMGRLADDPDNRFVEGINALQSAHQREINAVQTKSRMRSRIMNGYYAFSVPVGYEYRPVRGRGKMLFRKEPVASIITEALEGFASGRFDTQAEVARFLEAQPDYPKAKSGRVTDQKVHDLLTRVTCAGYVQPADWGIGLTKGHHEALISFEIFQAIQHHLAKGSYVAVRKDLDADFPLRGFVSCGDCGAAMTACWAKGRTSSHAYYMCFKRGCVSCRKSIRREAVERDFETLLATMQPSRELFDLATALFRDLWNERLKSSKSRKEALQLELKKIERTTGQFLDLIVQADSLAVIKAYETRIKGLESDKIAYAEKIANCGKPLQDLDTTFRTALGFLASPCKLWASECVQDRRAVLKMAFAERPQYIETVDSEPC